MKQIPELLTTGGLAGQGYTNLLGRPKLGLVPLVLREAAQNSWDARRRGRGADALRFLVRIRNLSSKEEAAFRRHFDQDGALEPRRQNTLATQLAKPGPIRVLELADFGTLGLSGATRPDLPTKGEESRFVNFFFDVGRSHEESGDGGTYGFGRSSLYTSGKASMVIVDSLVEQGRTTERRVMACRIGQAFEVSGWRNKGRYSGRHFWGTGATIAQPVTGSGASKIAEQLGMPSRTDAADTGTTVMIPWPAAEFNDGNAISRSLLYHLWPKMVRVKQTPAIHFDLEVDGRTVPIPDPEETEEYRLFVEALKMARTRRQSAGAREIQTLRPRYVTGHLAITQGVLAVSPAPQLVGPANGADQEDPDESPLNKIALMRPSELVVCYLPVPGADVTGKSWAGVFICSDAAFVRTAFARSEPPAHDDWTADRLEDRHERYIVRKTVQSLLPDVVRDALGLSMAAPVEERSEGPSLAGTSARFAMRFLGGDGQGAPESNDPPFSDGGKTPLSANGGRARLSRAEPVGIEVRHGVRVARFRLSLQGEAGKIARIRANPSIHTDDRMDSPPQGMRAPTVVAWEGAVGSGDGCAVTLDGSKKEIDVLVSFNDEYGVRLDCILENAIA